MVADVPDDVIGDFFPVAQCPGEYFSAQCCYVSQSLFFQYYFVGRGIE